MTGRGTLAHRSGRRHLRHPPPGPGDRRPCRAPADGTGRVPVWRGRRDYPGGLDGDEENGRRGWSRRSPSRCWPTTGTLVAVSTVRGDVVGVPVRRRRGAAAAARRGDGARRTGPVGRRRAGGRASGDAEDRALRQVGRRGPLCRLHRPGRHRAHRRRTTPSAGSRPSVTRPTPAPSAPTAAT